MISEPDFYVSRWIQSKVNTIINVVLIKVKFKSGNV